MTKIHHDFASNEEGLAFTNGQVTGAQDARDAAVSANNVARAGLGDDVAGADGLAQRAQIDLSLRGETLAVADFVRMAEELRP